MQDAFLFPLRGIYEGQLNLVKDAGELEPFSRFVEEFEDLYALIEVGCLPVCSFSSQDSFSFSV